MPSALDPGLLSDLRKALRATECFHSDAALFALFVDARIAPWRYHCKASSSVNERVDFLIDTLYDSYNDNGNNALWLFLAVLKDRYPPEDAKCTQFADLLERFSDELPDIDDHPIDIPFVNREYELDKIQQTKLQTQYWVIYGPHGYGKTTFLNRIVQHYLGNKWVCTQVEISTAHTPDLHHLVATLIRAMGKRTVFKKKATVQEMGQALASCILSRPIPGTRQKLVSVHGYGVALALDNVEALDESTLEQFAAVISSAYDALCQKGGQFFRNNHCLCILLASHDARPVVEAFKKRNILVNKMGLSPYTYRYVQETIEHYMLQVGIPRPLPEEDVQAIAARLMYYSGGHPGCIAALLTRLAEIYFAGCDDFLSNTDRITRPVFAVLADFETTLPNPALLPVLEALSVYRRIDYALLNHLLNCNLIPWDESAIKLDRELSATHLTRDEEASLKDSITQRLLLIRFRTTQPAAFADICKAGIEFYRERFTRHTPNTASEALEYLYLCIQAMCHVENKAADELRNAIFEKLACIAAWFKEVWGDYYAPRLIYQLSQKLAADWELEFLANYFLDPEQYQPALFHGIVNAFNTQHPLCDAST